VWQLKAELQRCCDLRRDNLRTLVTDAQREVEQLRDLCCLGEEHCDDVDISEILWSFYSTCVLSSNVPDRDFHDVTRTGIYRTPDTDVRTVRHTDNWAESTTPSEWALSSLGTVLVWLGQLCGCSHKFHVWVCDVLVRIQGAPEQSADD